MILREKEQKATIFRTRDACRGREWICELLAIDR